jgi:hypothetical protein
LFSSWRGLDLDLALPCSVDSTTASEMTSLLSWPAVVPSRLCTALAVLWKQVRVTESA